MKYIQAKFILCAMLAVSPMFVSAQATDWNETDSLVSEKTRWYRWPFVR